MTKKESPLKEQYNKHVKDALQKKFNYKNPMQIPALKKIVISMGLAKASTDKQLLEYCLNDLKLLTGQKPLKTKAKKSVSNFKLREGQIVGGKVTLRGERMYDFMYRFIHITSPRIPDFRGFKRKGDKKGCYSLGLSEQSMFPEIDLDKMKMTQGMNITFVSSANTDDECVELLELMGLPLKKK